MSALGRTTDGLLPPEEAVDWPLDDRAKAYMAQSTRGYIEGTPDQVRDGILAAAEQYQTADLGIVTNCYYFEQRKQSYENGGTSPRSVGPSRPHMPERFDIPDMT